MIVAEFESHSPEETLRLGVALGVALKGGECIALVGPLGAGKTQLVKGIAAGNAPGGEPKVTSPTFTLIHEYQGRMRIFHIDAYRLKSSRELAALGFEELLMAGGVVIVEWADKVRGLFPPDALWIEIQSTTAEARKFVCRASDEGCGAIFDALRPWSSREARIT